MSMLSTSILAVAIGAALAEDSYAQNVSPRDAVRPAEIPVTSPSAPSRDGQDRKDIEKDRNDSDLTIERDKCGDVDEGARDRCIRAARAQRDSVVPSRGTAASPSFSSSSPPSGGGMSGPAGPAGAGIRR
jgi:hypothetical protein